ncbi:hypothetical protein GYMLUDRAFT_223412 [Collybiopsis luxurians FD-317 M1]|uniref:Uncharacterized protein n=1 Tax=Collybiopsis luxurians FD-317 M1 TaxID=944289 RepID=A0A0D0CTR2_9AGAR|nr:hypothetical protein GYMLUDRAFT_223412 [Collybiopsis luxurians FD-317 M1]
MSPNPSETYARLLLHHGHGYPLWFPEPNEALPEEYLSDGIRIGDVGLVTADGAFEFLFNVFLPRDHVINQWHGVPDGFAELEWNPRLLTLKSQCHRAGVPICSSGTESINLGAEVSAPISGGPFAIGAGIELKFAKSHGAVLMLPNGASRVDYRDLSGLRKHAADHAESWYQYINGPSLGLEAENGSLYLITGYDKTCTWEAAAFLHSEQKQIISLKFTTGGLGDGKLCMTHSSTVHSSVPNRSHLDSEAHNQAVFIRGFKICLRQGAKARLLGKAVKVSNIKKLTPKSVMYRGEILSLSTSIARLSCSSQYDSSGTCRGDMETERVGAISPVSSASSGGSLSSEFEELDSQIYHPSDVINEYILKKCPAAHVAVTHDNDWCTILQDSDTEFPEDLELIRRIEEKLELCVDSPGLPFFKSNLTESENFTGGSTDNTYCLSTSLDGLLLENVINPPKTELNSSINPEAILEDNRASLTTDINTQIKQERNKQRSATTSTSPSTVQHNNSDGSSISLSSSASKHRLVSQGARVCFFNGHNELVKGTVASTRRAPDGTILVNIRSDNGLRVVLPQAAITKLESD